MKNLGKILIISNNIDEINLMKDTLENNFFQVDYAIDVKTGIQKIEMELPNLIILNLTLQIGDEGLWLCRKYKRKDSQFKDIPIILLINKNDFELNSADKNPNWYPFDEVIKKPIIKEELINKVQNLTKNILKNKYTVLI